MVFKTQFIEKPNKAAYTKEKLIINYCIYMVTCAFYTYILVLRSDHQPTNTSYINGHIVHILLFMYLAKESTRWIG